MASQTPSGGFAPVLAGSNNKHTRGRAIDTYDRAFGSKFADGTYEAVDQQEAQLRQTGQLTSTGYHQDGFVVGDEELEEGEIAESDDEVQVDEVEVPTESRRQHAEGALQDGVVVEGSDGEDDEGDDEEYYEEDDEGDSDYQPDDSQDWGNSQGPDSLS